MAVILSVDGVIDIWTWLFIIHSFNIKTVGMSHAYLLTCVTFCFTDNWVQALLGLLANGCTAIPTDMFTSLCVSDEIWYYASENLFTLSCSMPQHSDVMRKQYNIYY